MSFHLRMSGEDPGNSMEEIKKADKIMRDAIYSLDRVSKQDGDVLIVIHRFAEHYAVLTGKLYYFPSEGMDTPSLDLEYMSKIVAEHPLMKSSLDEMKKAEDIFRGALTRLNSDDVEKIQGFGYSMVQSLYQMNLMLSFNESRFRNPKINDDFADYDFNCPSPNDGYVSDW